MKIDLKDPNKYYKIGFMGILIFFYSILTYYFHFILNIEIVFTHLFYIPIILAAIWWKRKGILVAVYLALLLIISTILSGKTEDILINDILRSVIFIFVSIVVIILSERIAKSRKIITESNEKYKSVVETAAEAIITISHDSRIVSWNKGAEKIFGYTEDEVQGKNITLIMPEQYHEIFKKKFKKFKPTKDLNSNKMAAKTALRKDHSEFPFEISVVNWKSNDEIFYTAIIRDITERKKFESELKSSKKRFETLFEYAPAAYYLNDAKGRFIDGNKAAEELIGYKKDELVGKDFREVGILPLGQIPKVLKILAKNSAGFPTGPDEIILKTKSGKKINVEISAFPIKLEGKRVGLGIARDVTKRKKAEELQARLAAIVENSDDAIIGENLDATIISWNKGAEQIYGYKESEIIGKNHLFLIPPEKSEEIDIFINKIKKGETLEHFQTVRYRKDGRKIYVSLTVSPIKDKDGKLIGSSIIGRDITQIRKDELALKESEELFRTVFNNVNDVITLIELKNRHAGNFIEFNNVIIERYGYTREELLKMKPSDIGILGEVDKSKIRELLETGKVTFERTHITKNGVKIPVEINSHIFSYKGKKVALSVARDISQRKKAEKAIKESERKLKIAMDLAKLVQWEYDVDSDLFTFNNEFYKLYGTSTAEQGGNKMSSEDYARKFVHPDDALVVKNEIDAALATDDPNYFRTLEHRIIRADGEERYIMVRFGILKDDEGHTIGTYGANQDITERKQMEDEIEQSLKEKEILLKEIHHRVKNNLMVISSLLNLQSRYIKDKAALDIFKESQNRAKSMAIIHEHLYRSTDLKRINFGEYIRTLSTELYHTYVPSPSQISLNINVKDLMLDINTSVPLGLIVNELVTNSMKHAFPQGKKGDINVELYKKDEKYVLSVEDNGIGFPDDVDYKNSHSLGLQLVNSLTDQIGGSIELDKNDGTNFKVIFSEEKFDKDEK